MKQLLYAILSILLIALGDACRPDTDEFIPTGTTTRNLVDTIWEDELKYTSSVGQSALPPLSIEKLIDSCRSKVYVDSINAETGGVIYTPDNVKIEFPANCFDRLTSNTALGKCQIEFFLMGKKGDFILNDRPTISGNDMLISGGAIYIRASKNRQELKFKGNSPVKVTYRFAGAKSGMQLFEGKQESPFRFRWSPVSNSPERVGVNLWRDSTGRDTLGYTLLLDRFGWINCDKFNDVTPLTNQFFVSLPDSFTNRNTAVFVVFKDIMSVIRLEGLPARKVFGLPNSFRGIPSGRAVTVISLSVINGRTYVGRKDVTVNQPGTTQTVEVTPQYMTLEDIRRLIGSL